MPRKLRLPRVDVNQTQVQTSLSDRTAAVQVGCSCPAPRYCDMLAAVDAGLKSIWLPRTRVTCSSTDVRVCNRRIPAAALPQIGTQPGDDDRACYQSVDQCRVERALYVVVDEAVWQPVLTGALARPILKVGQRAVRREHDGADAVRVAAKCSRNARSQRQARNPLNARARGR